MVSEGNLQATCICRGAVAVLVTRPTVAVSSVELGAAKLGVFGRLNTSQRNCSLDRSVIWNCLKSEKSMVRRMSGERIRSPELPYVKFGAATKAVGSNHCASVGIAICRNRSG